MADRVPELVPDGFSIDLVVDEGVEEQSVERARNALLRVARVASRPVLHGRIVLRIHHDPARERPAVAKASLNVGGRLIRAQVAAEQMPEAIDLLARRLRRNVEALEEEERAHRRDSSAADPGEWSHGSLRADAARLLPASAWRTSAHPPQDVRPLDADARAGGARDERARLRLPPVHECRDRRAERRLPSTRRDDLACDERRRPLRRQRPRSPSIRSQPPSCSPRMRSTD